MDQYFEQLLLDYALAEAEEERKRIEKVLWHDFGRRKLVLVLDMSGFSLLTRKYGVVHYLSLVKRMQLTARPIIEEHNGLVVKFEADNCFAMFDTALSAVRAAIKLNTAFDAINEHSDDPFDIRISIGMDYGDVLLTGGPDYFGDTVNRASKLGEDIAGPGEIILTEAAFAQLPSQAGFHGQPLEISIAGVQLKAFNLAYGR
ncbi:MAG: adenylate/guanylate cyclase domain-containing protein [Chloroflexota bacterium]